MQNLQCFPPCDLDHTVVPLFDSESRRAFADQSENRTKKESGDFSYFLSTRLAYLLDGIEFDRINTTYDVYN